MADRSRSSDDTVKMFGATSAGSRGGASDRGRGRGRGRGRDFSDRASKPVSRHSKQPTVAAGPGSSSSQDRFRSSGGRRGGSQGHARGFGHTGDSRFRQQRGDDSIHLRTKEEGGALRVDISAPTPPAAAPRSSGPTAHIGFAGGLSASELAKAKAASAATARGDLGPPYTVAQLRAVALAMVKAGKLPGPAADADGPRLSISGITIRRYGLEPCNLAPWTLTPPDETPIEPPPPPKRSTATGDGSGWDAAPVMEGGAIMGGFENGRWVPDPSADMGAFAPLEPEGEETLDEPTRPSA
ncbi:hypothetical protein FNF31_07542 [Cafeteria roenbergensis]|uniref:Uncharacterized protein n=1 Tax=Cafeteria roenbergensis TaxID=33653 RepID=A0A5A8CCY7_CAFRO|nr:hypothetical protein FNF31_07542 [Cafeteria roenbergensis]KAA0150906.1 hypothetical protein FNF28_07197 [Cafeteria roenbergensis]